MRLSYALLVVAATFLASCGATPESTQAKLSHVATADHVQPTVSDNPNKRLLRTAETAVVREDEDEERVIDVINKLKYSKYFRKTVGKDGTFSGKYVQALLNKPILREKTFEAWAKADLDGAHLKEALGNMYRKGRAELLNRYTASTKEVLRKPGNQVIGDGIW
ncbi:hypothetical protein PF011_g25814 [Phytophthora fragariae]|uniref:RxLR effector protein n=1 Tax=Phytophthora fragariae TaxID=53985 RepID=A0A6A3HUT2_9STRA|nr:hypothetical protein PF011_g25814 [Phytophthora fragariae]